MLPDDTLAIIVIVNWLIDRFDRFDSYLIITNTLLFIIYLISLIKNLYRVYPLLV